MALNNCFVYFLLFSPFIVMVKSEKKETQKIIKIPLERMESGLQHAFRQGGLYLRSIEKYYNMYLRAAQPSKLIVQDGKPVPTNDTLPLFKYFDTQYYGIVNIGKPGKPFKMIMDTAWAYSWVTSINCPRTNIACAVHKKYDHRTSSTYIPDNRPFNVSEFIGFMSKDVFLVGQLNSTNQIFAELTSMPWIYALYGTDGIIGLGFKDLSPSYTPLFYNLISQHKLKPIFSFYINRDPTTKHGGTLLFGGIDTKHNKSAFTELAITSLYYWQFQMDRVTLVISKKSSVEFCKTGCDGLADTSSNTIVGPADEIKEINRLIGAERLFFSNRYMIPCVMEYKGPKINFTMNNKPFQILGRDYIQKLSYSGLTLCLSAFAPAPSSFPPNTWTLGGAFLYQFYTAFDIVNRKMFIAEAA